MTTDPKPRMLDVGELADIEGAKRYAKRLEELTYRRGVRCGWIRNKGYQSAEKVCNAARNFLKALEALESEIPQ